MWEGHAQKVALGLLVPDKGIDKEIATQPEMTVPLHLLTVLCESSTFFISIEMQKFGLIVYCVLKKKKIIANSASEHLIEQPRKKCFPS